MASFRILAQASTRGGADSIGVWRAVSVPYASRHYAPIRGFFGTSQKCFRAGCLIVGKSLKSMVSAEGIESAQKRKFNNMQGHGWHF